ncbi:MAG TPA: class I SAM-dependent methyltransferase [Elusimicrobiales bacterium]|nr:class I SAM-dependent methyltransferase [Elusimicrobiales bacterium]
MLSNSRWHKKFFDPSFYNPASPSAVEAAGPEAAFMARALGLKKGMKLLDLCCGPGRHSLEFSKRGMEVTGVDATPQYLAQARGLAKKRRLAVRFLKADMRRLRFNSEFDAAINAFSSFGYFSPEGDRRVLAGVFRALKPGGVFLLDMMDRAWLEKNFRPRSWEQLEDGSYRLFEDSCNPKTGVLTGAWTVLRRRAAPKTRGLRLNLYDERSLRALLRKAGFRPLKRWRALSAKSGGANNRLVLLARKPGK